MDGVEGRGRQVFGMLRALATENFYCEKKGGKEEIGAGRKGGGMAV